jgi:hypothetical protein
MFADFGISDWVLIYVISGYFGLVPAGSYAVVATRNLDPDDGQRIQVFAIACGALGGLLGVVLIGPVAQIVWRTTLNPTAGVDFSDSAVWPSLTSLWYSSWMTGALLGGAVFGVIAVLIAKRWIAKN